MILHVLPLVSAALLALTFPKPGFAALAWCALIPWLYALKKQERISHAFVASYLAGVVFFSSTLYWITHVSVLGFVLLILYLALYFSLFAGIAWRLLQKPGIQNLIYIPAAWVALEFLRSHFIMGFSWALLGYSQYLILPVIQISDISGVYGVSFLIALVNVALFYLLTGELANKRKIAIVALVFLLSSLGYGYIKLQQKIRAPEINVAVIQGNIAQEKKWDPQYRDYILEKYSSLTKEALRDKPDLIVWPETSVPGFLQNDPELLKVIADLSRSISPAQLLVGNPYQSDDNMFNSATLLKEGKIISRYDKLHLVPFGEFMPMADFFSRFSFAGLIADFTPGEEYTQFSITPFVSLSALICFEDVFAHHVREFTHRGATLLVNMTNDAWFGASSEPHQHLQASVLRAVENRVNVVRSANTGVSCFIDQWGRIKKRVSDKRGNDIVVEGYQSCVLRVVSMGSIYTKYGDLFAWLCSIVTVAALIAKKRR